MMTVKSTKKKPVVEKARKVVPFITRHRPIRFSDMIGMESELNTLATSIEKGEIPNAFLLIGTTGGGKTTLARIIARTVMCETRNACGECTSCKIANESLEQHPDYEEINCGVNGKVDDIRSLTKMAETVPQVGKMRVIVLDECLPADAEVMLADGTYDTIENLQDKKGVMVMSFNHDTNIPEPNPIISSKKSQVETVMITIEYEGGTLECTANHKVWSYTRNAYIRADEILDDEEVEVYS